MARFHWPAGLEPHIAPVYTYNELIIQAPPEAVWIPLIRAASWSQWYGNCRRLRFLDGSGPDLSMDTTFSWVTFGVRVQTTVTEMEAFRVLAWHGRGLGAQGYHGWYLEKMDGGCIVITEEVQSGLVPNPDKLEKGVGPEKVAEGGPYLPIICLYAFHFPSFGVRHFVLDIRYYSA